MKAFTLRALILGALGVVLVCTFASYSDILLLLKDSIRGYLPVVPLILVALISFAWNSLAGRFNKRWSLGGGELAVIFCLMAVVCWLPAAQQAMVRQLALPRYEELTTNATWKEAGVTTRLPECLFPAGEDGQLLGEKTHFGIIQGGVDAKNAPYGAWVGPLLCWMPFILVLVLCLLALVYVVHRQWTRHEQLLYPLASVVDAIIEQDPSKPGAGMLRNRIFWFGFGLVFALDIIGYLHTWFPNNTPGMPDYYSLAWTQLFPVIRESNASSFSLNWMPISASLIGIAFLVPGNVSLSVGLTAPLATLLGVQIYLLTGRPISAGDLESFRSGGFMAFALILAFTGRAYYGPVFRKALWPLSKASVDDAGAVWAARVFTATYLAMIAITASMGIGLLESWIIVTFLLLMFLVVTRLVCETGMPMLTVGWSLPTVLTGLLGPAAVGAAPLMFMLLLGSTLVSSGSTTLFMPYFATSLKVLDDQKVNLNRFAFVAKSAIILAIVVGFAAVIAIAYKDGAGNLLRHERAVWSAGARQILALKDFGRYEASENAAGMAWLLLVRPEGRTLGLVVTGLLAVVGCYMLRFRFSRWPLHPLFFVIIGSRMSGIGWFSFLLGWALKTLVMRIGGGLFYRKIKPLFIGFILGEFAVIGVGLVVGVTYYLVTGICPVVFK